MCIRDSCEALIGAIYIDRGYNFVKNYILKIWKKNIDKSDITILDPKTKLQEYSLKNFKKLPISNFYCKRASELLPFTWGKQFC